MLKIDKKDEEIVVIFNTSNEMKRAFSFFLIFFMFSNIIMYFIQNYPIILKDFSVFIFMGLLLELYTYKKIEIYFKKERMEVYRIFFGIKRLKISTKYLEIKSMESIFLGSRKGNEIVIRDTANFKHSIVCSFLEKELDEIIKVYENDVKEMLEKIDIKEKLNESKKNSTETFNLPLNIRYQEILKKIIEEEKFYVSQIEEKTIINGNQEAIENLEIFKNMEWEEINFYIFYVNYLSKKENENKKVIVVYNGIDGKEITMLELKEDINEIRDSKSTFKN